MCALPKPGYSHDVRHHVMYEDIRENSNGHAVLAVSNSGTSTSAGTPTNVGAPTAFTHHVSQHIIDNLATLRAFQKQCIFAILCHQHILITLRVLPFSRKLPERHLSSIPVVLFGSPLTTSH